ncbi:hypothetical protein OAK22_00870 [Nitrosopumilus sp.]|nr:hypothetical protein [Nitrosopumilus sp.]
MNYKRVIISFGTIFGIVFIVSMLRSNLIQNEDNLEGLDKFSRNILENHKKDCESWQQSEIDRSFCKAEYDMMLKKLQEF